MVRFMYLVAGIALVAALVGSRGRAPVSYARALETDEPPLKLPGWWKAGDPLPQVKSNCVRCHLTAGRELTLPVRDLARSVHDRAKLSCNDCHGGDAENDATAHEEDKGFIGTKLSAHLAQCASCHGHEASALRKSKHYWDFKKRINKDYPGCIDCHGNHDVGKPPPEFTLTNVCADCHKDHAKRWPALAAVTTENDKLWETLRKVRAKNPAADPAPAAQRDELDQVREQTAQLIHSAKIPTNQEAEQLNQRVRRLREALEKWLQQQK